MSSPRWCQREIYTHGCFAYLYVRLNKEHNGSQQIYVVKSFSVWKCQQTIIFFFFKIIKVTITNHVVSPWRNVCHLGWQSYNVHTEVTRHHDNAPAYWATVIVLFIKAWEINTILTLTNLNLINLLDAPLCLPVISVSSSKSRLTCLENALRK